MKSLFLALSFLVAGTLPAISQSTAADFTANDCSGASHNLFTELNSGKVVVIAWVMPCGACINDARGAYDAAESFASSHPGKVAYYMVDDYGNTGCGTLSSWANTNGIKNNVTIFGNSGTAINEENYGGTGMPHIAVIGPDKKIYFNVRNGSNNFTAIQQAISQAIASSGVEETPISESKLVLYPNPSSQKLTLKYELAQFSEATITITNSLGQIVSTQTANATIGESEKSLDVSELKNGVYCLTVSTEGSAETMRFVISR